MKIRACRGVCVGVDRHLKAGDLADLDAAQVQFLVSIGAVERVQEEPAPAAAHETESTGASDQTVQSSASAATADQSAQSQASAEAGKKKK